MGWMQKLCKTYDNNLQMAGASTANVQPLTPVSHMISKAQIEITITDAGEFYDATVVSKENSATLIPVTEQSAGRSSGAAPHPLCDTIAYVGLDYVNYLAKDAKVDKQKAKSEIYLSALREWAEWEKAHYKVKSVYKYCLNGEVISDLIGIGILLLDDDKYLVKGKIEGQDYEKCLVRWRVLSDEHRDEPNETWRDSKLFDNYIEYMISKMKESKRDICYVTGQSVTAAVQHPKAIVRSAGNAKLISANDTANFTFRGRFQNAEEACSVSYEVSQKAHNALKWLVDNQGHYYGGRMVVCWSSAGKQIPDPDSLRDDDDDDEEDTLSPNTMPRYCKMMRDYINGYKMQFQTDEDALIMSMDAATPGRLSITYYNELQASDYLERIYKWRVNCCFYTLRFTNDKKPYLEIATPSIKRIVSYAFGTDRGQYFEVDDRVLKEHSQRLISCIIDAQPIPKDIVHACVMKVSNLLAYSKGNRERLLSTTCALLHKKYSEIKSNTEGEDVSMKLDLSNTNRSYLFGRLLAVAEKVERATYSGDDRSGREPNAIRYWNAYQNHPMHTWRILREQLIPYYKSLGSKAKYYEDLIAIILSNVEEKDSEQLDKALEDTYLLGYYMQRMELNNYNTEEKTKEDK